MKIELNNNKIFYKNGSSVKEIHPFWLRERANGEKYLDKKTQQRLFDPTSLNVEIAIKSARINNDLLEIDFNDGVNSKLNIGVKYTALPASSDCSVLLIIFPKTNTWLYSSIFPDLLSKLLKSGF